MHAFVAVSSLLRISHSPAFLFLSFTMDLDAVEDLMDMENGSYIESAAEHELLKTLSTTLPEHASLPTIHQPLHLDMNLPLRMANVQPQAGSVIAKLEDMLETVVDCLLASQPLTIHLKTRSKSAKQSLDAVTGILRNDGWAETKEISWPGKSQREAWKFGK